MILSFRKVGFTLASLVVVSLGFYVLTSTPSHGSPQKSKTEPTAPTASAPATQPTQSADSQTQPSASAPAATTQQTQPKLSPKDLYHSVWNAIPILTYRTDNLDNWGEFAHKYCNLIKSDEDAIKYANMMLETLDDPYAKLHSPKEYEELTAKITGTAGSIGVRFEVVKNTPPGVPPKPVTDKDGNPLLLEVGGAAKDAGLTVGDAIVSINGVPIANKDLNELKPLMKDKVGSKVRLVYRRAGTDATVDLIRREVKIAPVVLPTKRFGKVGYIYLPDFTSNDTVAELRTALNKLSDCDAYVLDVRHNMGGQVGVCLNAVGLFMDAGPVTKLRKRIPGRGYEETLVSLAADGLVFQEGAKAAEKVVREANLTGNKPLVLLVDEVSMSASEMLAGCLRDNGRAILVGQTTAGKGIGQEIYPGPNGTALRVTNLRYFTPKGTWVGDGHKDTHGLKPDHEVKLVDVKTLATEKDDQLNVALTVLNEKLAAQTPKK